MTGVLEFRLNTATSTVIAAHLTTCDQGFVPPLSTRVVIGIYADKIARAACRFEAWSDGQLIGLVAAYLDDQRSDPVAFVTTVSVVEEWQGKGIASTLLGQCTDLARRMGYARVTLEVDGRNTSAIRLYARKGFTVAGKRGSTVDMVIELRGT